MKDEPQLHGLTPAEVEESRIRHGANVLTPPPRPSLWRKFLASFADPLIRILLVALLLSVGIAVYEYVAEDAGAEVFLEPFGIFCAVALATMIGFWLEVSADRKFEVLNMVNDDLPVKVLRAQGVVSLPRREVVVGDVLIIEQGDEIVADGTLVGSLNLSVNESSLTGEPQAAKSHLPGDGHADAAYPPDVVLKGSTVIEGRGVVKVTAVGDATQYGKVYEASQIDCGVKTPLFMQFERLGRLIAMVSYAVGALIVIGRCLVFDWGAATALQSVDYLLTTVMLAITLIVVSVPEGLPMSVTLSLALSMRRMLESNNLVRKLHACETMGAATVICTDKTGTLTQNRMSVEALCLASADEDGLLTDSQLADIVAEGMAVNSTAFLNLNDPAHPCAVGNPTEGALLMWLHDRGRDYLKMRRDAELLSQLQFSTQRKYMATCVMSPVCGRRVVYVKGAPEIVMAASSSFAPGLERAAVDDALASCQSKAMRTLGFAYAFVPDGMEGPVGRDGLHPALELVFLGVCGMADPIRSEVPEAIGRTLEAGIEVKIVTGDNSGTAREIGRRIGLWSDTDVPAAEISGTEWEALSDDEAMRRAAEIKIMSRARPTDKSRLVQMLQRRGEVVAVTGDGTNDAPALNAAHVGLSMGDGTAVAKEASDITIMDNSFASITKAVMWGRSLYRNIQRFILFQLTVNIVACIIVVIGAFTGTESPLTVTQMLWVNLIMDTFAALALASLPPGEEVMADKPRRPSDFIITRAMYRQIIGVGLLFTVVLYALMQYFRISPVDSLSELSAAGLWHALLSTPGDGSLSTYDLTLFFTFFVFLQFWNLFNARAFGSGLTALADARHSLVFFGTAAVIVAGQFAIVYAGGSMFNVCPLKMSDMLTVIAVTSPVMLVPMLVGIGRRFFRNFVKNKISPSNKS